MVTPMKVIWLSQDSNLRPADRCTTNCAMEPGSSGPKVLKLFSCSTQVSYEVLLINLKLLTILNSFLLNIAELENFSANKYENANFSWHFHIY